MRNCVGSAVALIALSEPSGRFFIKGGHKEERGDGWRCPPDKSACTGNHCLVQPGSTKAPQLRVGTWQVDPSSRAACTRPQTSLFPRPILHGCTCQGLFVYPWSTPPAVTVPYCFPACQIILPWFLNYSTYFPTSFIKWENCAAWILGLCLSENIYFFVVFVSYSCFKNHTIYIQSSMLQHIHFICNFITGLHADNNNNFKKPTLQNN